MNLRLVLGYLGRLLIIFGGAMLLPLLLAIYYREAQLISFGYSFLITVALGIVLHISCPTKGAMGYREGFAFVTMSWLFASIFGSLPYLLSGSLTSYSDAFFETMSGLTTTGASVFREVESLSKSILLWRSLTHWLGGMGIMVLVVALLTQLGVGAVTIFRAESPGPMTEKLKPRIAETARILWLTYVLMTIVEALLLWLFGMSFFDSLAHTFGTVATGGFSTKNISVGFYQSPLIEWTIIVFMFLAGANFTLYYRAVSRKSLWPFWRNPEFRLYLLITGAAILLVGINIYDGGGLEETVRLAAFQVISIMTTTGFATTDFNNWPLMSELILLVLMFVGGSAGSTGGGIKVSRFLILFKQSAQELKKLVHPHAVLPLKVAGKTIEERVITATLQFFFLYIFVFGLGTVLMAGLGLDIVSAVSAVAATLGNVGPGLGSVGPMANYAGVPWIGKYFLSLFMLLGRLEIYTVLVLFTPVIWKR